jgi:nicotinate-nucleotide pyrophosphorylase
VFIKQTALPIVATSKQGPTLRLGDANKKSILDGGGKFTRYILVDKHFAD